MSKEKHIHIFEKSPTKVDDWHKQVYRCKDPGCSYYAQAQYIEGKQCRCSKCFELILVPIAQLWKRNKNIVCVMCSKSPKKKVVEAARKASEIIFSSVIEEMVENPPGSSLVVEE